MLSRARRYSPCARLPGEGRTPTARHFAAHSRENHLEFITLGGSVDGGTDPAQAGSMTRDLSPSPFELAAGELRKLGITLTRLPGEYAVSCRDRRKSTARTAETLDQAVELGRPRFPFLIAKFRRGGPDVGHDQFKPG